VNGCDEGDTVAEVAAASMLRFNAGGHINHSIFWLNLAPQSKSGEPSGIDIQVSPIVLLLNGPAAWADVQAAFVVC